MVETGRVFTVPMSPPPLPPANDGTYQQSPGISVARHSLTNNEGLRLLSVSAPLSGTQKTIIEEPPQGKSVFGIF